MAESELEQEGAIFFEHFRAARAYARTAAKSEGAALASRLRTRAIDLCHNKATEFNHAIRLLFERAAKVALLAHWPDEEALTLFERDVAYAYGNSARSEQYARN